MIDVEPLIEASFDRVLPDPVVVPDWAEVLERAGLRSVRQRVAAVLGTVGRRYVVAVAALISLVVAVGAAAYALGHPIIEFGNATPASSKTVVNFFGRETVGVPTGIAVLPHQARLITTAHLNGRAYPLWIAPIKNGGFCYAWKDSVNGCLPRHQQQALSAGGTSIPRSGPQTTNMIGGSFPQTRVARILLRYADGQSTDIPFVWVTAPINSGFFLYGISLVHQRQGHQPIRISLIDSSGDVIASQPVVGIAPPTRTLPFRLVRHQLAGYPSLMVPAPALWRKRQQLFSWRADTGTWVGLWIAPARGGGTCYWSNVHSGCARDASTLPRWPKIIRGDDYVSLCCTVSADARRVELTFQDGSHVALTPKRGYLIWPIPHRRYTPGHRLVRLAIYSAGGGQVGTISISPDVRGLYPCDNPQNYGYGLKICP